VNACTAAGHSSEIRPRLFQFISGHHLGGEPSLVPNLNSGERAKTPAKAISAAEIEGGYRGRPSVLSVSKKSC